MIFKTNVGAGKAAEGRSHPQHRSFQLQHGAGRKGSEGG